MGWRNVRGIVNIWMPSKTSRQAKFELKHHFWEAFAYCHWHFKKATLSLQYFMKTSISSVIFMKFHYYSWPENFSSLRRPFLHYFGNIPGYALMDTIPKDPYHLFGTKKFGYCRIYNFNFTKK